MRQKPLLLLLFVGISSAMLSQAIRDYDSTLIITEVSAVVEQSFNNAYIEITNVGTKPLDLANFKFGMMWRGNININCDWATGRWSYGGDSRQFFLPESVTKVLQPNESYVMTIGMDFDLNGYNMGLEDFAYGDRVKNHNIYEVADFIAHRQNSDPDHPYFGIVKDSVIMSPDSTKGYRDYVFALGQLRSPEAGFFIEQHYIDTETGLKDSIVIDQVKSTFTDLCRNERTWWSVAGVASGMRDGVAFRKSIIKKGQLDWYTNRGLGLDDSEWMILNYPEGWDNWREYWWTIGNHGDYVLDANTLTPKAGTNITVDFTGKSITVPWGTRRLDDIMMKMEKKPGLAWIYMLNETRADSVLRTAQPGDKLALFAIGETFYTDTFNIIVSAPLNSDNIVIPIDHANFEAGFPITNNAQRGKLSWPRVTAKASGIDTITGVGRGLPNDLRMDTLFKYLEKAPNAKWEIVTVGGEVRADIKNGDILKVTAENGTEKDYFLQVRGFEPSDNANLASITWPDNTLNPVQKFIYGWQGQGDTIPGFFNHIYSYRLKLPVGTTAIPALIAKTADADANLTIKRATTYKGSVEDRTTRFTIISESLEDTAVYSVEFQVDVDLSTQQPNYAEPFVSQHVPEANKNNYSEICNPGNRDLDLSYYMFVNFNGPPQSAIEAHMGTDSTAWANTRYRKYIPGRKWVGKDAWALPTGTGFVETTPDITVDAIVKPGEVFVMANLVRDDVLSALEDPTTWDIFERADVQFANFTGTYGTYENNWKEPVNVSGTPFPRALGAHSFFMFKILNDSVRNGTKAANDPSDFELIEVLAMANYLAKWQPDGLNITQGNNMVRKPEITKGNPVAQGSFASNAEESEWIHQRLSNNQVLQVEADLGKHFFIAPTYYMSTVSAVIYKVSTGYSEEETIEGIPTGTTVATFMGNLYPTDPNQDLSVKALAGGAVLADDAAISQNDTLVVVSADGTNTSKYILSVTEAGLSDDATLTSTEYQVAEDVAAGTGGVAGMVYGTSLTNVMGNVETAHEGAVITVVDQNGLYIPFKRLNYFNEYVTSTADYDTYLEVVAENTFDKILYQLQPEVEGDTAFITSFVYEVTGDQIIKYIPLGTSYIVFMKNIIASPGATVQIFDKLGFERIAGNIAQDDKVVATSPGGEVQTIYYLSLIYGADMLQTVPSLAFITSDVYVIDQVELVIDSVVELTTVSEFLTAISPATDAVVVIYDADGNVKADGQLAQTDVVSVTSADGNSTLVYTFGTFKEFVAVRQLQSENIQLYPNPTRAKLEILGLTEGSRIQVYNVLGAKVIDVIGQTRHEVISLEGESDGLYYIVISNNDVPVGNYKVIKN